MIRKIAVIGSGTMGNGIAHVFAQFGFLVALIDIKEEALQKALKTIAKNFDRQILKGLATEAKKESALKSIRTCTEIRDGVEDADLVIEAATENSTLKLNIFRELEIYCPPKTIFASNTSSISITKLASATQRAHKVIGMHFMNPVPVMKLVEVIKGYGTSEEVVSLIMDLSRKLEKKPVEVRDYPGFVANRILMPMINEAIFTLHEGVAGVQEIDQVMQIGMAHPMGPLQLADFIGLDVCLSILRTLHEGFGHSKYAPCPLLVKMVEAGLGGKKTGEGFYQYTEGSKEIKVSNTLNKNKKA